MGRGNGGERWEWRRECGGKRWREVRMRKGRDRIVIKKGSEKEEGKSKQRRRWRAREERGREEWKGEGRGEGWQNCVGAKE